MQRRAKGAAEVVDELGPEIVAGAAALGVELGAGEAASLATYARLLLEWNERVNLTAVTEPHEVARKHFVDSLSLLRVPALGAGVGAVADVGSGAGFPGLVVAAVRPDLQVTLIDALGKRVAFLTAVIEALGLRNVKALHLRAEEAGHQADLRERFDVVTARAVASLAVLAEYCLPLARVGGEFVAMKGPAVTEELAAARNALAVLGGQAGPVDEFALTAGGEGRSLVRIQKLRPTPAEYPRRAGTPERKPL